MSIVVCLAWLVIAAVHVPPAAVLFVPALAERLYGVRPDGAAGALVVHRGALFLAVSAACVFAAFHEPSRPVAALVGGLAVVGFLLVYARAGFPVGPLRSIAIADLWLVPPLILVCVDAWLLT